jgi:hydroxymethylpyrimidine/phosphomethylpyrimidine kinase
VTGGLLHQGARPVARVPIALTIAGSDSSGGAGIQADLKTFSALGVYGASVLTALTAQNTQGVRAVHVAPAAFVSEQIAAVLDDLEVGAIKTGMLANASIVAVVADALTRCPALPLIVDPVMVATSGDSLLEPDAVAAYKARLIPRAALITPNLPEAAALLGQRIAEDLAGAERQAVALLALGCGGVLLKGGHRVATDAVDLLALADGTVERIAAPWVDTANTHGTGCTLSAAIAAMMASGMGLADAVRQAKRYLTAALNAGRELKLGNGHGPVDHLFDIRSRPLPV